MYLQIKNNYEEPRRYLIFVWLPLALIVDIILEIVRVRIDRPFSKNKYLKLVDNEVGTLF